MAPKDHGVSGISIEGDTAAGQFYVPRAKAMLRRLVERARAGHVETVSDFVRLDDSAYCYAVVSNGIQRAVIVVEASAPPEAQKNAPTVIPTVPDFYSGVITDPRMTKPPPDIFGRPIAPYVNAFWPTPACAALFKIPPTTAHSTKLAIDPGAEIAQYIGPPADYTGPPYSQYVRLKPTMFSGLMCGVVQLCMGFGKQIGKSIYDRTKPPLRTPQQDRKAKAVPTQYEKDVKANGLQIRYDWRWYRTHGIGVGADGRLWLVEIGNTRGVIAMLLPTFAVVDDNLTKFREKLVAMGDSSGLYVLDNIKCWPTGEAFPAGSIDAWIRAGRVLRFASVADMLPFYSQSPYSSSMGWAFNQSGNEAHNTANGFADNGHHQGTHYAFSFTIGATTIRTPAANAATLKGIITSKSQDANYAANLWKIDNLTLSEIASLLAFNSGVDETYAALDAFTAQPIAAGSGHLWRASSGYLFKKGTKVQYELKFPWPELGYLVSFDMQRPVGAQSAEPRSDTDVHVFYAGDALKIVRFFNDPSSISAAGVEDDNDGCELVGTFTRTENFGARSIPPMVYSSDFDDRAEIVTGRNVTVYNGRDMGYSEVFVDDDITFPPHAHLARRKRFGYTITSDGWTDEFITSAMVVPFYDRSAYYYAVARSFTSHDHGVSHGFKDKTDPWSCDTWRNFPGFTGRVIGELFIPGQHPDGCGPVTARTVRSPGAVYDGDACSDFADDGPWCFVCDNADAMTYFIAEPPTLPGSFTHEGQSVTCSTWIMTSGMQSPLPIEQSTANGPWFIPSPDPDSGSTQYAEETHNAFGTGDAMRYDRSPNSGALVNGGPQPPGFVGSNATFVGVVP